MYKKEELGEPEVTKETAVAMTMSGAAYLTKP